MLRTAVAQINNVSLRLSFLQRSIAKRCTAAAATFESTCASNGVSLTLNVACAASSSGAASSSTSVSTSGAVVTTTTTVVASSTYTAATPTSTSLIEVVTSGSGSLSTSTAVVVFLSSDSTVVAYRTSTHWYTTIPTLVSTSSATPSSTPSLIGTISNDSQGSIISHGLTTGAKAGIGAGAGAAVVATTVFSLWLFWICRRKRRKVPSIADSDHYDPTIGPDFTGGAPVQEKRLASLKNPQELPSEEGSRKHTMSWGSGSLAASSQPRSPPSEDNGFHHSVSAESDQHSPPPGLSTYQRPELGNDGYWRNAQELQGVGPSMARVVRPAPASFEPLYQQMQSRPIVPPGRWPPTSRGGPS